MKTVFKALVSGLLTTIACWRIVVLLWLVNLVTAWIVVQPLAGAIESALLHNPLSTNLLSAFDAEVFVDAGNVHAGALEATRRLARGTALPWILLWTVLSAGVIARVTHKRRDFEGFLAACGHYGHRFFWLLVMTLLGLWAVSWVNGQLTRLANWWLVDTLEYGAGAATLGWTMTAKTLVALGLVGLVVHAGRIARLRVVKLDEHVMPITWLKALWTVIRRLPTVGLAGVLSLLPFVALIWAYGTATEGLFGSGLLAGDHVPWRYLLVAQLTQLLIQAALVYRFAVEAHLWPLIGPPGVPAVAPAGPVGSPSAGGLPVEGVAVGGAAAGAGGVTATDDDAPASDDGAGASTHAAETPAGSGGASGDGTDDAGTPAGEPSAEPETEAAADEASAGDDQPPAASPAKGAFVLLVSLLAPLAGEAAGQENLPPGVPPLGSNIVPSPADQVAALSEHRNAYVMDVTLDTAALTATVRQRATFINTSERAVPDLWLHLYAAGFANTETNWMRGGETGGVGRRGEELGGYLDIRSVRLADGPDLGDATVIDDTLMHVRLPAPVAPGERVTLAIEFVTRFPHVFARMGSTGEHLDGMQWYPKFCAHDAEQGWITSQFHRMGEFFADFGSYDVSFHYPGHVELEATGLPGERRTDADGTRRVRYRARDVHDFAFVASPHAERVVDSFTYLSDVPRDVEIVYLCQPYAMPKAQQVIAVVKSCLDFAGTHWMAYPYDRIVIDGLPHSLGGGMEYPMLFTISQRFPNHLGALVDGMEAPAGVTAHEFGHQYWYGIMASNEFAEAWLDEGVNSWATDAMLDHHFGERQLPDAITLVERDLLRTFLNGSQDAELLIPTRPVSLADLIGWDRSPFHDTLPAKPAKRPTLLGYSVPRVGSWWRDDSGARRSAWSKDRYYEAARELPLTTPSREFDRGNYGPLVYSKASLVLKTLENHIGFEGMQAVMRAYVAEYRFAHPDGDDFLALVSEQTESRHDTWLRQLITTDGALDFCVQDVTSRRVRALTGYTPQARPGDPVTWSRPTGDPEAADDDDEQDAGWFAELGALLGSFFEDAGPPQPGGAEPAEDPTAVEPGPWRTRYTVRQLGEIEAPVAIEARFADGSTQRDTWDGRGGRKRFDYESGSRLVEVVVDPDRLFLIDLDVNNNGRRLQPDRDTTRTLTFLGHFWSQNGLDVWSFLF